MKLPPRRFCNLVYVWIRNKHISGASTTEEHQKNIQNLEAEFRVPLFKREYAKYNPVML